MKPSRRQLGVRVGTLAALALGALVASLALSTGAFAGGGNSANAKKCQEDGWQSLITSTGGTFSGEGECTSYGAHGGVILSSSSGPCLNDGWQAPAQTDNGTAFTSEADCISYTSNGGVVYKPSLTALPSTVVENQNIAITAAGFHPNSTGTLSIQTLPVTGIPSVLVAVTDSSGGSTGGSSTFTPPACANGVTGADYTWTDGSGVHASASVSLSCP